MRYIYDFFIFLLVILIIALFGFSIYSVYEYHSQIKDQSITDRIEQLKVEDNYVTYNDCTYFLKALIYDIDPNYENAPSVNLLGFASDIFNTIIKQEKIDTHETITMKASNAILYKNNHKLFPRIASAIGANTIQSNYDQVERLEIYANSAYFGNDIYGIKEASNYYFQKDVQELNFHELIRLYVISANNFDDNLSLDNLISKEIEIAQILYDNNQISQNELNYIKSDENDSYIFNLD